jgi:hypothetical protein
MFITSLIIIILILLSILIFTTFVTKYNKGYYFKLDNLILCRDNKRVFFAEDNEENKLTRIKIHYYKLEEKQNMFYSKLRVKNRYLYYESESNDCYLVSNLKYATIFKLILEENKLDLFHEDIFVKIKNYIDDSLITCKNISVNKGA